MMANESSLLQHVEPAVLTRVLASSADIAVVLDVSGAIRDVVGTAVSPAWHHLIGQRWRDTVTKESQAKADALVAESGAQGQGKAREINQLLGDGEELPFRFSAVRVSPHTIVAIGRDLGAASAMQQQMLSAQQALEREYARLRQDESKYRMLYHLSSEGGLIVDGVSLKVVDVNPAAAAVFEQQGRALVGRSLLEVLEADDPEAQRTTLKAVAAGGPPITLQLRVRGGRHVSASVTASRQGQASTLLVRLGDGPSAAFSPKRMQMLSALDALPDGFVVLDESLHILGANPMFCELAQVAHEAEAVGQSITRWLGRPGVDGNVITATLREHGVVRNFATVMRGSLGQTTDVMLSAVSALHGDVPCVAFVLRPASARTTTVAPTARSVDQLRELVGQVSLKELVRESAELVERMCIEAALQLTGNNRASAAQLLGLSRQGLYSKLRRHGLSG